MKDTQSNENPKSKDDGDGQVTKKKTQEVEILNLGYTVKALESKLRQQKRKL